MKIPSSMHARLFKASLFAHAKEKAIEAYVWMRWALRARRAIIQVVFRFALASSSLAILSSCLKIE